MSARKSRISNFDTNVRYNTTSSPTHETRATDPTPYIRGELEREYQQKYQQLKHLYEIRVQTLSEGIREAFRAVQTDDLIDTMRQDTTSEEYIQHRVKEIIEECLNNQRESFVDRLSQENAELHAEFAKLELENTKV